MKILQVNNVYKRGSTGKITYDIHSELLKQGIESIVCYGRGINLHEPYVYKICGEIYSKINNLLSRLTGIAYGGCFFSTNRLIHIIKKEKPDVVHLQCLNGHFVNIYRLIRWLKKHNVKTVLTLHAEFMYTGGCGHSIDCNQWSSSTGCGHSKCPRYRLDMKSCFFDRSHTMWKRMKRSFDGFNDNLIVVSVSPWLMARAKRSSIFDDKQHTVVLNGVDTNVFHYYGAHMADVLKKTLGILKNEKVIFHVTPMFNDDINNIKGGYYVLKLAEKMLDNNIIFLVAGKYPEGLKVPKNVVLLGNIVDQLLLAQYYSMADITLLTSKKETFSMVTAESLCCGTPVVGFEAGAPEQIGLPAYCSFVEHANIDDLYEAVVKQCSKDRDFAVISDEAKEVYSKQQMVEGYLNVYKVLIKK